MSRRRQADKRPLVVDAKYHSTLVTRLVNTVMIFGKKSVAQRIVYGAFDSIITKNPSSNPLEILQRAVDNAKPRLEVKARRRSIHHDPECRGCDGSAALAGGSLVGRFG